MRASRRQGSSIGGKIDALVDTHYRDRARLDRIRALSVMARTTAELIHELQRERGLSSGFVAGGGRRFVQDLPTQRERTDQALVAASEVWVATLEASEDSKFGSLESAVGEARSALVELSRVRADVRSLALTPNSVVHQYSALVDRLLVIIAEIPGGAPHPQINLALIALFNFVLAKEYTGQLRALGSAVCAQGGFEPFQYDQFRTLLLRRDEVLSTFVRHGNREQIDRWTAIQADEAFSHWYTLRGVLEKTAVDGTRPPDADDWYRWSTTVIDAMRMVETALLDSLEDLSLLVLADTRSAWEDSQEVPDARDGTLLLRLERTRIRLWEERRAQRVLAQDPLPDSDDPLEALVEASAQSVDEMQRFRRDLDRWDLMVREVMERSRQARILALDANIEAIRRAEVAAGAQELAQGLLDLSESMGARLVSLKDSVERAVTEQDRWHLRAIELKKLRIGNKT